MTTEAHQRQPPVVVMTPRQRERPVRELRQVAVLDRPLSPFHQRRNQQQGEQAVDECSADVDSTRGVNRAAPAPQSWRGCTGLVLPGPWATRRRSPTHTHKYRFGGRRARLASFTVSDAA